MENKLKEQINEDEDEDEDVLYKFGSLTLYTDRIIELLNKSIIDYSS
jgi:hypothetical protein